MFLPCLEGGAKSYGPAIFHFVIPLPVINDQSLIVRHHRGFRGGGGGGGEVEGNTNSFTWS